MSVTGESNCDGEEGKGKQDHRSDNRERTGPTDTTVADGSDRLISFIIATYNRPDDLSEAVASILRQE